MQNQQNIQQPQNNSNLEPNFDDIETNDIGNELEGDNLNIPDINNNNQIIDDQNPDNQEEVVERQLKINTILEYKRCIGEELGAFEDKFDIDYLNGLTSDQLDVLITQIEVSANCANSASMIKPLVHHGLGLMELTGDRFGLKWQGLQNTLMVSKDFDRNITLIKLKYGKSLYVDPIYTACITILQTAMYLDQHHRKREKVLEHGKENVDKKFINEFKDL